MKNIKIQSLIDSIREQGITDEDVLSVIASIPRENFIDEALSHQAYDNLCLPIGAGQTISQPYIVAKMTSTLQLKPEFNVLEIGTGSGYQTAILSKLVNHVYSVERIKSLQWNTKRRLKQLDIHNVSMRHGNGWLGWAERGPFDAIIVTAAASEVPKNLLEQLADKGRMVVPVGVNEQTLLLIKREGDEFITENMGPVTFVPLVKGEIQ